MKIIIQKTIAIVLFTILSSSSKAQLSKDNLMVGGSIQSSIGNGSYNFGLYPSAAYFIRDYLALGGSLDLNYAHYSNNTNSSYLAISAMGRYYILHPSEKNEKKQLPVFIQGRIGLNATTAVIFASGGLGLNYFLTPNVALEGSIGANVDNTGFANLYTLIGFQIFLPSSVFKNSKLE